MSIFSSYKKIFLLGFILVILIAIPFSVYVAQKRQTISTKAAKSTTLSFEPTSTTAKIGDTVNLDIMLDPGTNLVSFAKLSIKFDASKFSADSLAQNQTGNALKEPIDPPQYDNTNGKATISLSIGADPVNAIKTKTKIATLQMKAKAETISTGSSVTFDTTSDNTQVLSIANADGTSENVLLSAASSATIIIAAAAPTSTPVPTSAPVPTGSPSSSSAPICSILEASGPTTGVAPYPLTLTATGSDSDGTISKISFNFGDSMEDLTTGGGIGTSSVSGQLSHTYNTPGTYTAYAILTDNSNTLSAQRDSCTKTITISSANTIPTTPPTQQPLPPTGDGKIIFGLGAMGVIFTIVGGVLLTLL
jgi:hypothetical protein